MFNNNLLMGAASASGESLVSVGNSALFEMANSESLTYTEQSGTSTTKQYISIWLYRCKIADTQMVWSCDDGSSNNREQLYMDSSDQLNFLSVVGGAIKCQLISTQLFRDTAWYNIEILLILLKV